MNIALDTQLQEAREEFIGQWGALGTAWGINRTMAQIHALLLVANEPLSTDDVMEDLKISRGNANTNLRDLVGWGLVHSVLLKGERKEYFEAEKDVWKIFCIIARERKRREIEPAAQVLKSCAERTSKLKGSEAQAFHKQMEALGEFVSLSSQVLDKVSASEESQVVPNILKLFRSV